MYVICIPDNAWRDTLKPGQKQAIREVAAFVAVVDDEEDEIEVTKDRYGAVGVIPVSELSERLPLNR